MTKELEALDIIGEHKIKTDINIKYDNGNEKQYHFETIKDMFPNQFALIETALKRLERLDSLNCLIDNNKKLKALEIIKKIDKNALLQFISVCVKYQEEYDLLKEVLLRKEKHTQSLLKQENRDE